MSERSPDLRCAQMAERQHGIIHRQQALGAGMSPSAINRRVELGRWNQLHPRVYAIAGVPTTGLQAIAAACMGGNDTAIAMYSTAAYLWGAPGFQATPLHVGCEKRLRLKGVTTHHLAGIERRDMTRRKGIRVTNIDRTLIELGAVCSRETVEDATDHAIRTGLTKYERLVERASDIGGHGLRGSGVMQTILKENDPLVPAPSWLERRFVRLFAEAGMGAFQREWPVLGGRYRIDFGWPALNLGIEAHSYRWHFSKNDWENDVHRSAEISAAGITLLPFIWRQVRTEPHHIVSLVRQAAGQGALL